MENKNYNELQQAGMRNKTILGSLEVANETGGFCKYSEEQILEAQEGRPRKEINEFYYNKIFPAINGIIYLIYYIANLIILLILFTFQNKGNEKVMKANLIVSIICLVLIAIIVVVIQGVDSRLKRQMLKKRPWIDSLNKFSADTSIFTYFLTSVGYMLTIMNCFIFYFIYIIMLIVFFSALYFDVIKTLKKNRKK